MKVARLPLPFALSLIAVPAAAQDLCPVLKPGNFYPWQATERMPGDFWADLLIDLDAKGKPIRCRIAAGNLKHELGFWFCNTMLKDGVYEPIVRDGVAVPGTVKRHMTMPGKRRRDADKAARKRYLAAHPQEKRCYPG
jgi:hypothetical protein